MSGENHVATRRTIQTVDANQHKRRAGSIERDTMLAMRATRMPVRGCTKTTAKNTRIRTVARAVKGEKKVQDNIGQVEDKSTETSTVGWTQLATALTLVAGNANAAGGEYGILEGRTLALLHPAVEFFLLGATLYAGYLGLQWRSLRTIGDEISELKKQVPAVAEGESSGPKSEAERKIDELTAKRKELAKGGFRDKHNAMGSLLLGLGVTMTAEGCFNTFLRTGKLFPGPHLYGGMGITVLWAMAAALVPEMQKGNNTARNLHIGLNVANVLLFVSQVPSGLEIVDKVFQFTSWP